MAGLSLSVFEQLFGSLADHASLRQIAQIRRSGLLIPNRQSAALTSGNCGGGRDVRAAPTSAPHPCPVRERYMPGCHRRQWPVDVGSAPRRTLEPVRACGSAAREPGIGCLPLSTIMKFPRLEGSRSRNSACALGGGRLHAAHGRARLRVVPLGLGTGAARRSRGRYQIDRWPESRLARPVRPRSIRAACRVAGSWVVDRWPHSWPRTDAVERLYCSNDCWSRC